MRTYGKNWSNTGWVEPGYQVGAPKFLPAPEAPGKILRVMPPRGDKPSFNIWLEGPCPEWPDWQLRDYVNNRKKGSSYYARSEHKFSIELETIYRGEPTRVQLNLDDDSHNGVVWVTSTAFQGYLSERTDAVPLIFETNNFVATIGQERAVELFDKIVRDLPRYAHRTSYHELKAYQPTCRNIWVWLGMNYPEYWFELKPIPVHRPPSDDDNAVAF